MKKIFLAVAAATICLGACAQDPISIIKEGITKVIKAVDLQVQRIQTATIGLQEVQKELENTMSALRLDEIRDWVQQQKNLYGEYFQELSKVKTILSDYHKVSEIIQRQKDILAAYQRGLALFRQDAHFSPQELAQMEAVFSGVLTESGQNLDRLTKIITDFTMQMTDQKRMEIIDQTSAGMEKDYRDLLNYTNENEQLSLNRAQDANDYEFIKKLYGL